MEKRALHFHKKMYVIKTTASSWIYLAKIRSESFIAVWQIRNRFFRFYRVWLKSHA